MGRLADLNRVVAIEKAKVESAWNHACRILSGIFGSGEWKAEVALEDSRGQVGRVVGWLKAVAP